MISRLIRIAWKLTPRLISMNSWFCRLRSHIHEILRVLDRLSREKDESLIKYRLCFRALEKRFTKYTDERNDTRLGFRLEGATQSDLLEVDIQVHRMRFIDTEGISFDRGSLNREVETFIKDRPGNNR